MKTAIFVDFDGTVTRRDVGYNIFNHFSNGKNDELIPDWKASRISSRECLTKEAEMISPSDEEFYQYLHNFEIDPSFEKFVSDSGQNGIEVIIISDGLDLYIDYLMEINKLNNIKVISNKAVLNNGTMRITFPYDNKECDFCGNCKGERIKEFRDGQNDEYRIVFIGDGCSDKCAVKEADILFAKKDLEIYCEKNNIEYVKYDNFVDVSEHLRILKILKQ